MATRRNFDARKGNFSFGKQSKPEGSGYNRNYRYNVYLDGVLMGFTNDANAAEHLRTTLGAGGEVRDE